MILLIDEIFYERDDKCLVLFFCHSVNMVINMIERVMANEGWQGKWTSRRQMR